MAGWTFINSASASSAPSAAATTTGIDTTGASLIVIGVANLASNAAATVTDSQSNTWTALTRRSSVGAVQLFYCASPSTNASHTFTAGAQSFGMVIGVVVVASTATSPFDSENGSASSGDPGTLTPASTGCLVVSAAQADTGGAAYGTLTGILAPATLTVAIAVAGGTHFSFAMGYGYQSKATTGMALSVGDDPSSATAAFLPAASGGGASGGAWAFA